jgi:iron complex transport system substrate-binding protein
MNRWVSWSALWIAGFALACGGGGPAEDRPADQAASIHGAEAPTRIVAIAPSITEMLFVLGLGDRVVGVGDYARWPPEVAGKPRLGGLFDSRLESIAGLNPDLAILLPSEERLRNQLEKMGVDVLTVRSETIADVEEMAVLIGTRCGVDAAAEEFLGEWRRGLAPMMPSTPARVLLSVTREPGHMADVLVSGPGTFLDELLVRLGAVNVMGDAPLAYPQVGLEEIIIRQPEVVIELQASPRNYDDLRLDWERLASEVPVGEVCIKVVAGDHVLIPGPRLPRLYRELEEALLDCAQQSE